MRFVSGFVAACLATIFVFSNGHQASAATFRFETVNLPAQNCDVFAQGCYRGNFRFDYNTVTGAFSNVSWELGHNNSQGLRMESTVTSDQPIIVEAVTAANRNQIRAINFGGAATYEFVFYSNVAPVVTKPGATYAVEISGPSGSLLEGLILDIDLPGAIAGTNTDIALIYQEPLLPQDPTIGSIRRFSGSIAAVELQAAPVPLPAGGALLVAAIGAFVALKRRRT